MTGDFGQKKVQHFCWTLGQIENLKNNLLNEMSNGFVDNYHRAHLLATTKTESSMQEYLIVGAEDFLPEMKAKSSRTWFKVDINHPIFTDKRLRPVDRLLYIESIALLTKKLRRNTFILPSTCTLPLNDLHTTSCKPGSNLLSTLARLVKFGYIQVVEKTEKNEESKMTQTFTYYKRLEDKRIEDIGNDFNSHLEGEPILAQKSEQKTSEEISPKINWDRYPSKSGVEALRGKESLNLESHEFSSFNQAIENYARSVKENKTSPLYFIKPKGFLEGRWKDFVSIKPEASNDTKLAAERFNRARAEREKREQDAWLKEDEENKKRKSNRRGN